MLRLEDVHTFYGNIEALKGVERRRRAGPDRHDHRLQRRRQVHAADDHLWQPEGGQGQGGLRGSRHHAPSHLRHRQSRHQPVARGPPHLPADDGLENLQMGAVPNQGRWFDQDVEKVFTLFPRLKERMHQRGGTLSGGEQQMLAIGRALLARRGCCCSTSRRWVSHRSWSSRSSRRSSRSTVPRASPSCWSSRTRTRRSRSPIRATCWPPAAS